MTPILTTSRLFPPVSHNEQYRGWRFVPSFADGSWMHLFIGDLIDEGFSQGWSTFYQHKNNDPSGLGILRHVYSKRSYAEDALTRLGPDAYIQSGTLVGPPDQGSPLYPAHIIMGS